LISTYAIVLFQVSTIFSLPGGSAIETRSSEVRQPSALSRSRSPK
jgi:hypothetical protein